jgi:phosphomannomutase
MSIQFGTSGWRVAIADEFTFAQAGTVTTGPQRFPMRSQLKKIRTTGRRRVERTNRTDGVKFIFADGSWLLMRSSGTEPLVRIYTESESAKNLEVLLEQGRKYLLG